MIITTIFKFVNWLKNAFKWVKDVFDLIKWGLAIFAIVSSFGWIKSCSNKNKEISNVTDILTSQIDTFRTKTNLLVTQTETWQLKYKFLEDFTGEIKAENSDLKNELIEANNTIKDLDIRFKDVKNYIKNELVSKDSTRVNFILDNDCKNLIIEPIESRFWSINFYTRNDSLDVIANYHSKIYTILNLQAKRKKRAIFKKNIGKKHFIFSDNIKIWGFDSKTTTILEDTTANIKNIISIEIDK